MGILIGILAVVLNRAFCFLLLRVEKKLAEEGKIPPRGEILYLEDYLFFRRGDKWFLSIMDFAVAFVLVEGWPLSAWVVVLCLVGGVAWTALWHRIYLGKSHRPDSAYPFTGVVSLLGRIHLLYFGAQYTLGFMGIGMVVLMALGERQWSPVVFPGLLAVGGYFVTFFSDYMAGRFRRI